VKKVTGDGLVATNAGMLTTPNIAVCVTLGDQICIRG